jgi:conjugative transfer signal peptidase TraF
MTRVAWLMATYLGALSIGVVALFHPLPRLIWNASASVPVGLYEVHPAGRLHLAELVAVMPPEPLASFLADRDYLPEHVPLLKHIAALPDQRVCRIGNTISIGGHVVGTALDRDSRRRVLPRWSGCRTIEADQVFLFNRGVPDSLDSRYFGPLPRTAIMGRAGPLWLEQRQ